MKQIKEIIINFENVTGTEPISAKYINNLCLKNIHSLIQKVAIDYICEIEIADYCYIELDKYIDTYFTEFNEQSKSTIFQRILTCSDITSIDINYVDDTTRSICLAWDEENDYTNNYQTSFLNKDGNLIIEINKKPK